MNEGLEPAGQHRDYTGAKIGMWLFLATEFFLFAVPFLLYAVYHYKYSADFHDAASHLNLTIGSLNTFILLTSSLTMAISVSALRKGDRKLSAIFLACTILMGAAFLVNKYFEWGAEIGSGIYPDSATLLQHKSGFVIFFGLYFFATGMHGLHVLAGIALLSVMTVWVISGKINQSDFIKLEISGLYWHLVDIIWIYLFPLFYLIA